MSSVAKGFRCFAAEVPVVPPRCQREPSLLAEEAWNVADGEADRLILEATCAERLSMGDEMSIPGIAIPALIPNESLSILVLFFSILRTGWGRQPNFLSFSLAKSVLLAPTPHGRDLQRIRCR